MLKSSEARVDTTIVRPVGFTPTASAMDVPRPHVAKQKRKRRIMIIGGSVLGLILVTVALSRLKPAVPSVDRSTVWIDTVKRGPMVRQVRGLGTLVPEQIRWIQASTEGRVEKIIVWPGTQVEADTVILELSSPELEQTANDAESKAKAAEAELTTLRATLQRELLDQESITARVHSEYEQAKMERQTNDALAKNGLVSELVYKTSKVKEEELANRDDIEKKRLAFSQSSIEPQIASKQAAVDQAKELARLKLDQVSQLHVKAGMTGVLQQLPVQIGQRVKVWRQSRPGSRSDEAESAGQNRRNAGERYFDRSKSFDRYSQRCGQTAMLSGLIPRLSRERLRLTSQLMAIFRKARGLI